MYVLVTCDVAPGDAAGRRRVRHVAKACLDYGQRVQNSVFELSVNPAQWAACRDRLIRIVEQETVFTFTSWATTGVSGSSISVRNRRWIRTIR